MRIEELYSLYLKHPSIQTDTRKLEEGDLFFSLKGPLYNGNLFAEDALSKGAAYALVDDETLIKNEKIILVEDVLSALQELAYFHRKKFSIPVIGITGSNGKTTTKELVHAVLSTKYKTYTTEGNLNNHIGVPISLLKIRNDAEMAIIEMGANHRGEIASYCRIASPTHGLITNVGKAHLEGFGSEEGIKISKGELFDHLRKNDGTVFIMNDYEYLHDMSKGIKNKYVYGSIEGELVGESSRSDPFLEIAFTKGLKTKIKTGLVGAYNLPNVLAAAAIGKYFNVPDEKIVAALEGYIPSNSRSQLLHKGSNTIILDAYNANPSSMKTAIENFALSKEKNKILMLGAMAEMGAYSLVEHKNLVNLIKAFQWKHVILVGGDFLKIDHPFETATSAEEAGEWIKKLNLKNACILVKGSRSTAMEKVLGYL